MCKTITKRTLTKWRKEALKDRIAPEILATNNGVDHSFHLEEIKELSDRILRLTLILLDQELMKGK